MAKKIAKKVVAKKVSKENEVAVIPSLEAGLLGSDTLNALANYNKESFSDVDLDITGNSEIFSNDIVVPKLWLMQEISDLAKDKTRKDVESGDYVDSQSEEVVLKVDGDQQHLPFIVVKTFKRWQTFKIVKEGTKITKEFVKGEIIVLGKNHDYPYEFSEAGVDFVRRQVISAYVLLGNDVQNQIIKPYILDFASSSKGGGRALVSDIKVLNSRGLPSYVGWFKLSAAEDKYGEHEFFVKNVKFGGILPETLMPFLKEAYTDITSMMDSNSVEIDDRDVHDAAKASSENNANVTAQASENAQV